MNYVLSLFGLSCLLVTIAIGAGIQVDEHPNAPLLGKLVYRDASVTFEKEPAKDVLQNLEDGLDIMMLVIWKQDEGDGLDPTQEITLELKHQPTLVILERIVAQLDPEGNAAWQLRHGALEIGLKTHLASTGRQRLETYYIRDLLFTIRNFDAPNLGTFDDDGNRGGDNEPDPSQQEEIDRIIDLIVKFIEPELWEQNGGTCSITNYKETLLIKAPDFIHRQINGYSFVARQPSDVRERRVLYNKGETRVIVDRLPLR
jgi:hypothetical protein